MGKLQGIFQFTGKIGEAVGMRGDDGQTYARVRVRKIANPNTEAQQKTRTIASLAGKISSITSSEIIRGMRGSNKRQRRASFTKNIMLKAKTVKDITTGETIASLDPVDLLLAEGQTMALPAITTTLRSGVVSVAHQNWPENLAAVVVVAYGATDEDSYVECRHVVMLPSDQSPATFNVNKDVKAITVYAIPVSRAEGASRTSYESALEALEDDREFAVVSNTSAGALEYNKSEFLGLVTNDQQ